jgi:solute carrier family 25 (mitochondrial folate transporter), member 32
MKDFLIGFSSSVISSTTIYPMEVIKTNYQVSRYSKQNFSAIQIVKNIWKQDKFKGFYRGLSPHLMTQPMFYGIYFQSNKFKHLLPSTNNIIGDKFIASFTAGMIASTVSNPFFVIRTRFQTSAIGQRAPNISIYNVYKDIYKKEGLIGLQKGLPSTLFNNSKLVIQFPLYDYLKERTDNIFLSSFTAKIISNTIFYPFDLIRTNQRNSKVKLNIMQTAKHIYQNSNPGISRYMGFYRGALIYNSISIPNFVLLMFILEQLKKLTSEY